MQKGKKKIEKLQTEIKVKDEKASENSGSLARTQLKSYNEYGWEQSRYNEIEKTTDYSNYRHHNWAIVNHHITQEENAKLAKLVGDLYRGEQFPKSIQTNDYMFEIDNKIIFSDGVYNNFSINKIIEIIDLENIDNIKEIIYYDAQNNQFYEEHENLFKEYSRDGEPFNIWKQRVEQESISNSQRSENGTGSSGETKEVRKQVKDFVDSEGEEISQNVAKWNENNKFVNEEGNILRLYHGSTMAGFMEFSENSPIFLTDNFDVAWSYGGNTNLVDANNYSSAKELINSFYENYSDADVFEDLVEVNNDTEAQQYVKDLINAWENQLKKEEKQETKIFIKNKIKNLQETLKSGYLATYKNAIDGYETFSNEQDLLYRFQEVNQQGQNIQEELDEVEDKKGNTIYSLYAKSTNPLVINARGKNFLNIRFRGQTMSTDQVAELVKQEGKYDGIIFENIMDNGALDRFNEIGTTNVYVVFKANQVKATTNQNPTTNPDIRYSVKDTETIVNRKGQGVLNPLNYTKNREAYKK